MTTSLKLSPNGKNDAKLIDLMGTGLAEITGPTDQLKIIQRLIWLKDEVKNTKPNAQDSFDFELALLNLEELLNRTLPDKYGSVDDLLSNEGPDINFSLPDLRADLGQLPQPTANPPPENIKHILFDLKDVDGAKIYDGLEAWMGCFQLILDLGLTKKSQLAILKKAGYKINDLLELKKEPEFYKATLDPATNQFQVEKIDPNKPVRYTKENIDNFRAFATGYNGPHQDIFTKEKTIKGPLDGNDVKVYANRLPEECFGFQPGDVYENGGDYLYINGGWFFDGETKIFCDILSAQNAEEAMDLAFYGKDYDELQSDNAVRKGNPNQVGDEKHPNINLQFNEVKDATGAGATDAPKYDDPAIQVKIDQGYQLTKDFIADYEKLLAVNVANLNKTQLTEAKTKGSELGKKIYQNCQPDQNGFTEQVFGELKKLVKLLEETHGTKTANTKTELEKFISDSKNDPDKKKALEIAKKVKNHDNDSKDCVELAREKLKTPQEKQLEKAHQQLKSLLAGLKINGKDAYEEVVADIKDSEIQINKAIEIWQKCQAVETATNDDEGKLLNALNNFKNDTSNSPAWKAVNKYKKDGEDIRNAKTKAEFQKAKEEFMKKHEYKNNKQDYDEIYLVLAEKAAEIREKGASANAEEKELTELMVVVLSDYND
ncbi:7993_t:CDS:2 [Ambispora leptoticha]|uniref:7993_t:CDS:1 n=1 Tax=Ambispora leptoticha TaxID=144679 RepID=A0A9N9BS41_9GLOM|nr:7993_t:CDS:2 [Ambispora leptoticha]